LLPAAIEEMLRFAPPVIQFRARLSGGHDARRPPIAKGDKVVIFYVSANRDETVFEHRTGSTSGEIRIRMSRSATALTSASAPSCELEARVIFTELLTRLPTWRSPERRCA